MLTRLNPLVVRLVLITVFLLQLIFMSPVLAQERGSSLEDIPTSEVPHDVEEQVDRDLTQPPSPEPVSPTVRSPENKPNLTSRTYPQPPNPYNREAIEEFDQELYGAGR